MDPNNFYKKTEQYVTDLFNDNMHPALIFHNLEHTKTVVNRTKEIAGHYYLSEKDMLAVYVAAWFHDTGYLFTDPQHHEEKSVELMKTFMHEKSEDGELVDKIEECVMATRTPHQHENLLQQILCDADTYHLGTKEFKDTNKKVWEEYTQSGTVLSEKEWALKTMELLKAHRYYTKYCKDLLEDRKQKNMKKMKKISEEKEHIQTEDTQSLNNLGKDSKGLMSKGIQTMLRLTSENHLRLSDMADSKANILISVNAIIISIILGVMLRKLEEVPYLTIPTVIFLLVAVTTIVISIIATRPKISGGTFTNQEVLDKKTNLLFFGNFHRSSYEEYNTAMREMMRDTDYLYGSLIKDIYTLGTVLGRKYKLIRLAYNIFMVGIVVSVLAFGVAVFFFQSKTTGTITPATGSPFK
ncbi:MAG TPA: Pycsar system effector family protein [Ferruginibacter sp.]|nr:Pycsar system effector family protein [Ferruginibacter sp.]